MNYTDYNAAINAQIERCKKILTIKGGEYADDCDPFETFKVAAAIQNTDIFKALGGMMAKHTASIYHMIGDMNPMVYSLEKWDEKITDHINYLLILSAMVHDAYENEDL